MPQAVLGRPAAIEESLYEALAKIGRRPSSAFLPDGRAVEFTPSIYRGDACDSAAQLEATTP